jgi:alkylmercury lyase-like protein
MSVTGDLDMTDTRIDSLARQLHDRLLGYGADHLRLLVRVMRELARGQSVSPDWAERQGVRLGLAPDAAGDFLRQVSERDGSDQIVGAMGLSLNDHPHRLLVAGVPLHAWCALDTLFLPALLGAVAQVESPSPATGRLIRVRVGPEGVEEVTPAGAVISIVLADQRWLESPSVEAIWSAFCDHVHFFVSRKESEGWVAGRDDLTVLSVNDGFALGRRIWSGIPLSASD